MTPRLLDLFCCEGGAARGYAAAGFEVVGVDLDASALRHYPYESHQADALEFLAAHGREFDAIHASPPCQAYSITKHTHAVEHAELVEPTRLLLNKSGRPWVMENVPGAPMPGALTLCGSEFGLRAFDPDRGIEVALRRHRLFESSIDLWGAGGCSCNVDRAAGRIAGVYGAGARSPEAAKIRRGGYTPAKDTAARLLGIEGMTMRGLQQCIPPAYTQHIGEQMLASLVVAA